METLIEAAEDVKPLPPPRSANALRAAKSVGVLALVFVGAAVGGYVSRYREAEASRNSAGTYSPTAGVPVVSGTQITSTMFNNLISDIGSEMTNSLDRNGRGGMLAALRGIDGTVAAPSHSFTSETGSGLYRIGASDVGFAISGAKRLELTSALFTVTPAATFSSTLGTGDSITITKSGSASDVALSMYEASLSNGNTLQLRLGLAASNNSSAVFTYSPNATAANSTACMTVFGQSSTLCVDGNNKTTIGSGGTAIASLFTGTCNASGGTPSTCTLTVPSGSTCLCTYVSGGGTVISCITSVAGTTATMKIADTLTGSIKALCTN